MSEEIIIELTSKVTELEQKLQAVEADKTKEATDKEKVVSELIEVRKQKAEALEELNKFKTSPTGTETPEEIVRRELMKRDQVAAEEAKKQAEQEFKARYNEFNPETDPAGIAFEKFKKELSKFQLSDLKTKEDYINRFNEVYDFMNRSSSSPSGDNFYSGSPRPSHSAPVEDSTKLSSPEQKLLKQLGWTKEKYLEHKQKRPSYIAGLLKFQSSV